MDAVDTVTAKLEIIMRAKECNVPVISCMGAGNKLDPTQFEVADIYKTSVCPLARVMRRELKNAGSKIKGRIFQRAADQTDRGYEYQLPVTLCLPSGNRPQMHRAP